uniref:Uncharacterized protein n=1 Tax=Moniliophthora roreri TaxID=221103 RepID=A0A0W0FTT0_MONRR
MSSIWTSALTVTLPSLTSVNTECVSSSKSKDAWYLSVIDVGGITVCDQDFEFALAGEVVGMDV